MEENKIIDEMHALENERASGNISDQRKTEISNKLVSLQVQLSMMKGGATQKSTSTIQSSSTKSKSEKLNKDYHESVAVAENEEADPANPYQNWQDLNLEKNKATVAAAERPDAKIFQANRDHVAEEAMQRQNINAKMNEINAPGLFTKNEADRIKKGLDPARAAEVDAQTTSIEEDEKADILNSLEKGTTELFSELDKLGRNDKREQLRTLRQRIQALEANMDAGRA